MFKLVPGSALAVFVLPALLCQSAFADGMSYRKHYRTYRLAPERHVVEVVQPPYSGNFIINGARFTARLFNNKCHGGILAAGLRNSPGARWRHWLCCLTHHR